jgi:uncharacterized coiled-coil protein SlyX
MTHTFNISFQVKYLKDLNSKLTEQQRGAALAAANARVNKWLADNPIPAGLAQVQTLIESSTDIWNNKELLTAIYNRFQDLAPHLPGEMKNATINDKDDPLMNASDCHWEESPPTPPLPAYVWKCGDSILSLNTRLDFVEVQPGDWQPAAAGRGQARCIISPTAVLVKSMSPKSQQ